MKKSIDYALLIATIFITLFGAYMVLSATFYNEIFGEISDPLSKFMSDFEKILLGFVGMIIGIFINMKFVKKMAPLFMFGAMGLMLMAHLSGRTINGSTRFLKIGGFNLSPGELIKLASILYLAKFLEFMDRGESQYKKSMLAVIIFAGTVVGLFLVIKDLSGAGVYCVIIASMVFVAGGRLKEFLMVGLILAMIGSMYVYSSPSRTQRLIDFLAPSSTAINDSTAQNNQALMAIANGEVLGVGSGDAYQTKNGMPLADSDFMFASLSEVTGFVGALVVLATYIFMAWRMGRIIMMSESRYGALVVTGVMTMILFQALIHILYNIKLFPTTGLTLPFISAGGTSKIVLLASVGLVLNISSKPKSLEE